VLGPAGKDREVQTFNEATAHTECTTAFPKPSFFYRAAGPPQNLVSLRI